MWLKKINKVSALIIPFFIFLQTAFAEEPTERHLNTSSKALVLVRNADIELAKGTPFDIQKGVTILESVLSDVSFKRLALEIQMPIFLKLASSYQLLGAYEKEEDLLTGLINDSRWEPYWVELKVYLASSYIIQGKLEEAENYLKKLAKISPATLPQEERDAIALLIARLEDHYEKLLAYAAKRFEEKLYLEAISSYQILLHAVKHNLFPKSSSRQMKNELLAKLRYRLGICYFLNHDYPAAETVFTSQRQQYCSKGIKDVFQNSLFYLGCAQKNQGHNEDALSTFQLYLKDETPRRLRFSEKATLYAAFCAYVTCQQPQARLYLQELLVSTKNKPIVLKAKLILAKIAGLENNVPEALALLDDLCKYSLTAQEALYLKGSLFLNAGNIEEAIVFLEKAVSPSNPSPHPNGNNKNSAWSNEALYLLGTAYLNLAKMNKGEHNAYIERSETCFLKLNALKNDTEFLSERAILGLAQHYFVRIFYFSEVTLRPTLKALLQEKAPLLSKDGALQASILLAQIEPSYEKRKKLFQNCTTSNFSDCPYYASALYLQALNDIEDARNLQGQKTSHAASISLYEKAFASLQEASLHHASGVPVAKAFLAIPDFAIPYQKTYKEASAILENLPLQSPDEQEEIQFLLIKCYTQIDSLKGQTLASRFLTSFPNSQYTPQVLHLLALHYAATKEPKDALELFSRILKEFPEYCERAHVLYSMANIYETEEHDFEKARSLRKQLRITYPQSPHAAEAYFREFPEKEYQLATPHAIFHLQDMLKLFPKSPYSIAANFYVGNFLKHESRKSREKQMELAKEALFRFSAVDTLYEEYIEKNLIEHLTDPAFASYLQEIQVEALLGQGALFYEPELEGSEIALKKLNSLLENYLLNINPLEEKARFSRLLKAYPEGSYLLASVYEKRKKQAQARKQLEGLIEWHNTLGLTSNFLSSAYLDLAIQEQKMDNFTASLDLFEKAEQVQTTQLASHQKSSQKGLIKELLLEIKIAKSECFRQMGKLDTAMTLLSEVINDEAASSLRIKAMLLRAEIYELQHRHDLAVKQLEAASAKGGEWGIKAETKLGVIKDTYGYK